MFTTSDNHKIIAEVVQQMWRKQLKIDARLVNQELKVYYDTRREMNYESLRSTWIGDYADPNSFLNLWITNGANNQAGWSNPEYDRLIAEAGKTSDQAASYRAFQQAESIPLEDAPILPFYFYTPAFLIRPAVEGWFRPSSIIIPTSTFISCSRFALRSGRPGVEVWNIPRQAPLALRRAKRLQGYRAANESAVFLRYFEDA